MKKNSKLTLITEASLAAVAGLAIANGNVVKADTTAPTQTPHTSTTKGEVKPTKSKAEQLQEAKADADWKKEELQNAKDANGSERFELEHDQQFQKDRQDDVNKAQSEVDAAQKVADEASPENVAKAQQNLTNAQNATKSANEQVNTANDELQKVKADSAAKKVVVDKASEAFEAQNQKINDAQKNLDKAKNDLYQGQSGAAQKAYDDAKEVTSDKDLAYRSKENGVLGSQEAVEDAKNKIIDAVKAKEAADSDYAAKQATTKMAQDKAAKDADAEKQAEEAVQHLNDLLANHFVLNDGYITTIKNADTKAQEIDKKLNQPNLSDEEVKTLFKEQSQLMKDTAFVNNMLKYSNQLWQANKYISNDHDKKVIVDIDNMTPEQLMEINKYTIGLINSAREQLGRPALKLNNSAIKFAQSVAENYVDNGHTIDNYSGHDVPAIQKAAKDFGLNDSAQLYENEGGFSVGYVPDESLNKTHSASGAVSVPSSQATGSDHTMTMDDLKNGIYEGLKQMLFADNEWYHATGLLNTVGYNHDSDSKDYYFGMSLSRLPGETTVTTHYETVTPSNIKDSSKFNINDNMDVPSRKDLQNQLFDMQNTVSYRKQTLIEDNTTVANAEKEEETAKAAVQQAQTDLDNANKNLQTQQDNLSKVTQAAATAKQALDAAKKAEQDAKINLQAYKQALAAKKQAVSDAETALKQEQAKLDPLYNAWNTAEDAYNAAFDIETTKSDALRTAKNTLTEAQNAEREATWTLARLQNAPKNLVAAKAKLADAQKELESATRSANATEKRVEATQAALDKAQKAYDEAKAVQDKAQKAYDEEQAQLAMQEQVAAEQARLQQEQEAKERAAKGEEYNATLFVPVINNKRNWKVRVLDNNGHYVDKYVSTGKTIKVLAKKTVNGRTFYKIADNEWIPAEFTLGTEEQAVQAIAYMPVVNHKRGWKVALMDENGHYTGKYLSTNTSWKVFAKKVINGRLCYRLGTQAQWVPADYLVIR